MKNKSILAMLFSLVIFPFAVFAQAQPSSNKVQVSPNAGVVTGGQNNDAEALADVLAVQPSMPLGPADLLKEYEQAMAVTAQKFSADVQNIAAAVQQNQITEDQGEYLCNEAYQLAMMQFQAFSGLHDMLEQELSQKPAQDAGPAPESGASGSGYQGSSGADEFGTKKI
jgi:hypothetical protein